MTAEVIPISHGRREQILLLRSLAVLSRRGVLAHVPADSEVRRALVGVELARLELRGPFLVGEHAALGEIRRVLDGQEPGWLRVGREVARLDLLPDYDVEQEIAWRFPGFHVAVVRALLVVRPALRAPYETARRAFEQRLRVAGLADPPYPWPRWITAADDEERAA